MSSFPAWEGARRHNPCPHSHRQIQPMLLWPDTARPEIPHLLPDPNSSMLAESSSSSSWAPTKQSHHLSISCHISLLPAYPDIPPLPGARGGREIICCEINCSLCHVSTAMMASVFIGSTEKRGLWTVFHHGCILGCNSRMEIARFQFLTPKSLCFLKWTCQITQFITKQYK